MTTVLNPGIVHDLKPEINSGAQPCVVAADSTFDLRDHVVPVKRVAVVLVPDLLDRLNIAHHQLLVGKRAVSNVETILILSHRARTRQVECRISILHSILAVCKAIWGALVWI